MTLLTLLVSILLSGIDFESTWARPSLQWSAQQPGFSFRQRAEEILRRSANVLLQNEEPATPVDRTDVETTGAPSEQSPSQADDTISSQAGTQRGMLMTNSSDILPIILPTFEGLPISNTWYTDMAPGVRVLGDAPDPITMGQVNMQRWLSLMHLAADPRLLDNNQSAAVLAFANIPGEKWQQYFNCGGRDPDCESLVTALNNQPGYGSRVIPSWKGTNIQEWDGSHRAFVEQYGQFLISQASALPQEMYVAAEAHLSPYSAEQGGLPIDSFYFLGDHQRGAEQIQNLTLARNYSAAVPDTLADTLLCSPSECEDILEAIPDRQLIEQKAQCVRCVARYPVYVVVKVRVDSVLGSQSRAIISPGNAEAGEPRSTAEIVGAIEVYADKELGKRLHQFAE